MDLPKLPRLDDPLAALRPAVERHQQVLEAARAVGEALAAERQVELEQQQEQGA